MSANEVTLATPPGLGPRASAFSGAQDQTLPLADGALLPVGPGPVSTQKIMERAKWAIETKNSDPIEAGRRLIQVGEELGLTLRQVAHATKLVSESGLQNLVGLTRLPNDVLELVRTGRLDATKAMMLGRYLVDAEADDVRRAAASIQKHRLTAKQVQARGILWRDSKTFDFPP